MLWDRTACLLSSSPFNGNGSIRTRRSMGNGAASLFVNHNRLDDRSKREARGCTETRSHDCEGARSAHATTESAAGQTTKNHGLSYRVLTFPDVTDSRGD